MKLTRNSLIWLAQAAAALLMFIAAVEIALRLAGIAYLPRVQPDPVLGMLHRPGAAYWQRDEGLSYVEINSDGFRDSEWAIEKPAAEFRIAVLGDSCVEALQVPVEERFTELLAQKLAGEQTFAGKTVRVMNFGMAGFGTGQELLVLRDRVAKFRPDLVVLGFLSENDLADNCRALQAHSQRPYFIVRDGGLILDDSFARRRSWKGSFSRAIANESRIAQLVYEARRSLRAFRGWIPAAIPDRPSSPHELGLDDQVYLPPQTPAWREAWDITERLLLACDEEARRLGAKFLVVVLSNDSQVHPDPRVRARFIEYLGVSDLMYSDERIERVCKDHAIPVLVLAPAMLKYADASGAYLHGFGTTIGHGHWNPLGHELAADLIAGKIVELQREANRSSARETQSPTTAETAPRDARTTRKSRSAHATSTGVEPPKRGDSRQNP